MNKELLFKVVTGKRGKPETYHEYEVFADGSIKGFGDDVIYAKNGFFPILNMELARLQRKYEESPTKNLNISEGGGSQDSAA